MKRLKNIFTFYLPGIVLLALSSITLRAQDLDKDQVHHMVQSKEFTFKAQTVMPMSGGSRQLTTDYDVRFLGDSIISYLPYFGRSYTSTYGSEAGGVDFTSTSFDYTVKARKKGGWDVTVKPKDHKEIQEMNFTISENGSTSLRVSSTNRQPISYYGNIVKRK